MHILKLLIGVGIAFVLVILVAGGLYVFAIYIAWNSYPALAVFGVIGCWLFIELHIGLGNSPVHLVEFNNIHETSELGYEAFQEARVFCRANGAINAYERAKLLCAPEAKKRGITFDTDYTVRIVPWIAYVIWPLHKIHDRT